MRGIVEADLPAEGYPSNAELRRRLDGVKFLKDNDPVNHPSHYAEGWSNGAEVIDITENLNFNRGNAIKYIARAGVKSEGTELEDLRKAQWYLQREIGRVERGEFR